MAYSVVQGGSTLYLVDGFGRAAALTLPTGITVRSTLRPRFTVFGKYVVMVNSPSRPITIDGDGTVRPLVPNPPSTTPVAAGAAGGSLSGTYLAEQTFLIYDKNGNVIAESGPGPVSNQVTIAGQYLQLTSLSTSPDTVSASRIYRSTTNGSVMFPWQVLSGNTQTSMLGGESDASLGIVAISDELGAAPDLTRIASWGGRLWGVDRNAPDTLRYTGAGLAYGWTTLNNLLIQKNGADSRGINALVPRRDALGVARADVFQQVTGSLRSNFTPTTVNGGEQTGVLAGDSVAVFNDVAYFLGRDGVYTWDASGVNSITNGRVRTWFTTDSVFNRAMFRRAYAQIDPDTLKYRLFLALAGSTAVDHWIEYDILTQTWWGPHSTRVLQPSAAFLIPNSYDKPTFHYGSFDGSLSRDQDARNDWGLASIAFSVKTQPEDMSEPDYEKLYGELSVFGKVQPAGTMSVTPTVGEIEGATAQAPFSYDMTAGRQRLGRIGSGKQLTLQFDQDVIDQDALLFGYEVNPVTVIGRR